MSTNTIRINGQNEPLAVTTQLSVLLSSRGVEAQARGVAVALNGRLVRQSAWADTRVSAGDALEIVQAKQGG